MVQPNYFQSFKHAIVRIHYRSNPQMIAGAGFLVGRRQILTCAHVVAAALDVDSTSLSSPEDDVSIDFPLVDPEHLLQAKVVCWHPVMPKASMEDIAVMDLQKDLPSKVESIALSLNAEFGGSFRCFGFPRGHDDGVWATGVFRDVRANGWVQLDSFATRDRKLESGFSGAPIWGESQGAVVGMAVAANKRREEVNLAYMIPTDVLSKVLPQVDLVDACPELSSLGASRFREMKQRLLNDQLGILMNDYEALYNQLNYTGDGDERNRVRRKLIRKEDEIREVERSLSELGNRLD